MPRKKKEEEPEAVATGAIATEPRSYELFFEKLEWLNCHLVSRGWPDLSAWWRSEIERFIRSGKRRWVIRVGRRGGKSTTLCRVAVAWALWGPWDVPPGDDPVVSFLSANREQSKARLRTISAIFRELGIKTLATAEQITLPETDQRQAVLFSIITASNSAAVGFTSIAIFADEMARWFNKDTNANPAYQVMASLRPTLATQRHGFEVCYSSPWLSDDYHAKLYDGGDTASQLTSYAPTWVAHPALTEDMTRAEEPNRKLWEREYKAIPPGIGTGWMGDRLEQAQAAEDEIEPLKPGESPVIAIDPDFDAGKFRWSVVVSRPAPKSTKRVTYEIETREIDVAERSPLEAAKAVREELKRFVPNGSVTVYSDQEEGWSFQELASQAGLSINVVPWESGERESSKLTRYRMFRMGIRQRSIVLQRDQAVLAGLGRVHVARSAAGVSKVDHDRDRSRLLVLAASVALMLSPTRPTRVEPEVDEMTMHRLKLVESINKRNRREWQRRPRAVMRRAMGLVQ